MVGNTESRKGYLLSAERIVDSDTDEEVTDASVTVSQPKGSTVSAVSKGKPLLSDKLTPKSNTFAKSAGALKGHSDKDEGESPESSEQDESEEEDKDESEEAGGLETRPAPFVAEQRTAHNAETSTEQRRKKQKTTQYKLVPILAVPFVPDTGFEKLAMASADNTPEVPDFLSSDLDGKHIWHITAPANLPVRSIESFNLLDAQNGKAIFEHDGRSYGFFAEPQSTDTILLPEGTDFDYVPSTSKINSTFHLREINSTNVGKPLSNVQTPQWQYVAQQPVAKKPIRQQPKGLRMHYKPFGSGAGNDPENFVSDESDAAEDNFHVPAPLPQELRPQGSPRKAPGNKSKKPKSPTGSQKARVDEAIASPASQPMTLSDMATGNSRDQKGTTKVDGQSSSPEKQKKKKKKRKLVDEDDSRVP